jgi:hypothetical protein
MNEEELKFVELKKIYSNYRVLFEQQATGYLVYRLHSLLLELFRLVDALDIDVSPKSAFAEAKALLADVLETLPTLAQLRDRLGSITGEFYKVEYVHLNIFICYCCCSAGQS